MLIGPACNLFLVHSDFHIGPFLIDGFAAPGVRLLLTSVHSFMREPKIFANVNLQLLMVGISLLLELVLFLFYYDLVRLLCKCSFALCDKFMR